MNSNTVFQEISEPAFRTLKDRLNQRFRLIQKSNQEGVRETFVLDVPEGRIRFLYFEKKKLMIQASPTNSEYATIVDEISKSLSKAPSKQYENAKIDSFESE